MPGPYPRVAHGDSFSDSGTKDGTVVVNALEVGLEKIETSVNKNPLRVWHDALATRYYSPAKVVVIGASVEEGGGASTFPRIWAQRFITRLREKNPVSGVTGGIGMVSVASNIATPNWPVTKAGTATVQGTVETVGFKQTQLDAAGEMVTFSFTGTKVDVWFNALSGGTNNVNIKIDGSTVVGGSWSTTSATSNLVWSSGALSAAAHTCEVSWVAGASYVTNFFAYNGDESAGIYLYNMSRSSLNAYDLAGVYYWRASMATINPHLVILDLGYNDSSTRTTTQIKADIRQVIGMIRGSATTYPSIALLKKIGLDDGTSTTSTTALHAAFDTIVAEDPGGIFLIEYDSQQDEFYTGDWQRSLIANDWIHPTDKAHARMAEHIAEAVNLGPSVPVQKRWGWTHLYHGTPAVLTMTTAAAPVPPNSLLLAFIAVNSNSGAGNNITGVTDTLGLTWTRLARKSKDASSTGGAGSGDGAVEIWWANTGSTTSGTTAISAAMTTQKYGVVVVVAVQGVTGVKLGTPVVASGASGFPTASVTPTAANSLVFTVMEDWNTATNYPMYEGRTSDVYHENISGIAPCVTVMQALDTSAVTVGQTGPTGQDWNLAAVEVKQ